MFVTILTYILSSIFAIAGMGAAGVLIPNYIALGLGVNVAMILGLSQNTAELTVATIMNARKQLIDWKKAVMVLIPAVILVPIGAYININIPKILVLVAFALFLLFALYKLLLPSKNEGGTRNTSLTMLFGALEGFIGGLIGMDAAPIAIIAFSYIFSNSKKISANTAAVALGVSTTTLITYSLMLPAISVNMWILLSVATAGLLGGITGALLMHRIKQIYIRYTMIGILALAFVEIFVKIFSQGHFIPKNLYYESVISVAIGLIAFIILTTVRFVSLKKAEMSKGKVSV
jgi:uncharacterized membrane protein YfcA